MLLKTSKEYVSKESKSAISCVSFRDRVSNLTADAFCSLELSHQGLAHVQEERCRGPAPVDPGNLKVGTVSASLEKYIFNYRYIERLETDSVVGDSVVEKRRLNPDGNSAREMGARKKQHGGISLSRN